MRKNQRHNRDGSMIHYVKLTHGHQVNGTMRASRLQPARRRPAGCLSDGGAAAVDGERGTRDIAGTWRGEEVDHLGDLTRLGGAPDR